MKFLANKSFQTSVAKSDRVLEIAESFGLGLSDKKFKVYENLEIEITPGEVVYITGQSGSGKSLLLRDIAAEFAKDESNVIANLDHVTIDGNLPLIDQIGKNTSEGLELMNQAGLNDAYLWVRKPGELSDGQRYRFKLAKIIESGANIWLADEFGAVLDRETAKIVAYNVSRAARHQKATLVIATTHTDLKEYLGPTLMIEKLYGTRVDLSRYEWKPAHD